MSRKTVGSLFFALVLLVGGLFSFQVFSYYQKIQNGTLSTLDLPTFVFADKLTTSQLSKAAASAAPPSGTLATDDDPSLGSVDAVLTIVEFADFQCPYSQEVSYVLRRMAELYGGTVRVIFRDYPLVDVHPDALLAAGAAECAHEQGQFWAYHDKLFANQNALSRASLIDYASQVGMSKQKFESCLNAKRYEDEIANDMADGAAAGVLGTPTFFFNGHMVEGSIPESTFAKIIQAFTKGS